MTPAEIDRVFGLGRQQMATGTHVEVFRERAQSGEERRYTKGFLTTASADFRPWTEREWRILERLGKHAGAPVAKPLDFLPADATGPARLQTRDAGATVEQWATGCRCGAATSPCATSSRTARTGGRWRATA